MPGSPERFARHVAEMTRALGEHCSNWITIAEPAACRINGWSPVGSPPAGAWRSPTATPVLDNLLCAHVLAARGHRRAPTVSGGGHEHGCSRVYDFDGSASTSWPHRASRSRTADLDEWIALRRREFAAALARPSRSGAPRRVSPLVPGVGTLALRAHRGGRSGGSGGPHRGGSSASSPSRAPRRPSKFRGPSSIPARSLRATRPPPSASPRGAGISPTRSHGGHPRERGGGGGPGAQRGGRRGAAPEPARGIAADLEGLGRARARRRAHRVLLLPLAGRRVRLRQLRAAHRPLRHGPRPWDPRHPLARDRQRRRRRRSAPTPSSSSPPGAGRGRLGRPLSGRPHFRRPVRPPACPRSRDGWPRSPPRRCALAA